MSSSRHGPQRTTGTAHLLGTVSDRAAGAQSVTHQGYGSATCFTSLSMHWPTGGSHAVAVQSTVVPRAAAHSAATHYHPAVPNVFSAPPRC